MAEPAEKKSPITAEQLDALVAAAKSDSKVAISDVHLSNDNVSAIIDAAPKVDTKHQLPSARFQDCSFDSPNFENIAFGEVASFGGATFGDDAMFGGATFGDGAMFGGAMFGDRARFDRATFGDDAAFDDATFGLRTRFDGATFSDGGGFDGATFGDGAWFDSVTFGDGADFDVATFGDSARFYGATFGDFGGFDGATFSNHARFGGATFGNEAGFCGAIFGSDAGFTGVTFGTDADFSGATFGENAEFAGSVFGNDGCFAGATFGYGARFGSLTFGSGVRFDHTSFHGDTFFGFAIKGDCTFSEAKFEGFVDVELRHVTCEKRSSIVLDRSSTIDFSRTRFAALARIVTVNSLDPVQARKDGALQPQWLELLLNDCFASKSLAVTGERTRVDISGATFEATASFASGGAFKVGVNGSPDASPGLLLHAANRCSLANVVFESVDLSQCQLSKAYSLADVQIVGKSRFCKPPENRYARKVIFDEVIWRDQDDGAKPWRDINNLTELSADERIDPELVQSTYRSLRHALERGSNAPGASDFYFGEMEARFKGPETPLLEKGLVGVYKVLSGYGTKALWAFGWMLWLLMVTSALAYHEAGEPCTSNPDNNSLLPNIVSLPHGIAGVFERNARCSDGLLLQLLSIATAVMFGLWLFALRSRTKR